MSVENKSEVKNIKEVEKKDEKKRKREDDSQEEMKEKKLKTKEIKKVLNDDEFQKIQKNLDISLSNENVEKVKSILQNFISIHDITPNQLKTTKIAKTVGNLKKYDASSKIKKDKEINELSKKLIDHWKSLFKTGSSPVTTMNNTSLKKITDSQEDSQTDSQEIKKSKVSDKLLPKTNDKMRDFVIKKISNTLYSFKNKSNKKINQQEMNCIQLAENIESSLFKHCSHQSTNPFYKSQYSNINFNLGDDSNPDFALKVFNGIYTPEILATLSASDMASDAHNEKLKSLEEERVFENAIPSAESSATDIFECGKCKQRKCTYFQMQTRSADEPMTTFVNCLVCGNRWKFS
eukprot:gene5070-8670_t